MRKPCGDGRVLYLEGNDGYAKIQQVIKFA